MIKQQQNKFCNKTKERHQKKLDNFVIYKRRWHTKNLNQTITNLSVIELNNDKLHCLNSVFSVGYLSDLMKMK